MSRLTKDEAAARLAEINARMNDACDVAKRAQGSARLVAVSKTFDAEAVRPFLEAGQRIFGENRVQEAKAKWPQLRDQYSGVELHLIGPLQSNKVREALELFDVIETLDREKLAAEFAKERERGMKLPKLYCQVNTGEEEQKAGIRPRGCDAFVKTCCDNYGLEIEGLMCIPPVDQPSGPHFALLNKMADKLNLSVRSMGMSADYEEAIWCGATHVRVGSALFGSRDGLRSK
ncbi:MAG: YggS family pyridoxal phosphate-dependent enzyme [Pseudomonadota bacterium]